MNLEYTDEQRELRDAVRRFLSSPLPGGWRALAELGATGVLVPVDHGGAGLTMVEAAIVAEEAGAALLAEPWLATAVAVPRALTRFDVDDDATELLTAIADGDAIVAVNLARDDLRTTTTSDGVALSGTLACVADAEAADVIVTTVHSADGVALYRLPASHPSVTIEALAGIDPTHADFRVEMADAPAVLLGTADLPAYDAWLDDVFVTAAADALGAAQHLLHTVVEYAKTRSQFGQPIGSFQAIAHLCADMYEIVELARSGVMHAAWSADNADPVDRHLAALRLKGYAGRLASVGDTAIQVLGGIGFTWEHEAHRYLKRLLSWSSLLGGPDRYLEEVGRLYVESVVA